ncbi:SAM-dependent methyltransferase [Alkalilimnicola ehrlichii]|uniref:SAM-dependent methyltransferase n=1 Tax=Alkalilimnicola ehrlichii TaxID=351052 RepID=A0A3E0WZX7_9GAMM|nr:class I SAM-dependent methyltransferase [Alkalilimnicola ehrlichii]RFA29016.1 SAM-dependent methyltransferase [Alkalilimnicola ehrlichii]RFA38651.1 SAM-dependent methyltransferase [Alkalilimnicola ehrlichii]
MQVYNRYLLPYLTHFAMRMPMLDAYRREVVRQARGNVLELGAGSGLNLALYEPRLVSRVYALEPEPGMIRLARTRLTEAAVPVEILPVGAEAIPLPDCSIDTVLSTWTLCTIPDIKAALSQARRVLKPNGQFLFVEHGLSNDNAVARWQHRLTPFWSRCAGGCQLDRPHANLLRQAGFVIDRLETGYIGRLKPMTYTYRGQARRADSE